MVGFSRAGLALAALLVARPGAAPAATYTWNGGGGANTNWSNPANWGGAAPGNAETNATLIFPALAAPYASHNDLNGLRVASLAIATQVAPGSYLFTGNALVLDGTATMASPAAGSPNLVWQIPLSLGDDATIATSGRQTQLQGPVDLGDHTLTLDAAGDIVLAGAVGGDGNLVKQGSSALTITGANSYRGATTSNGGALYIATPTALGDVATGTTIGGGFLGFVPGSTFATAEPFVFAGGSVLAYGTPAMSGAVRLDATTAVRAFEVASVLTIGGAVDGGGGLTKTGPGLLILHGPAATYAGPTSVDEGTLRLETALAGGGVTVKSAAALTGNGSTAGAIDVRAGGTIAPGTSPGALTCAGLRLAAGATLAIEIDGPAPATQYDRIAANGPVDLGGATLAVALGYAPPNGQEFTLVAHGPGDAVAGSFAGLAEGAAFQVGGTTFGITYAGGSGGDVVLVAGPTGTPVRTPTTTAMHTAVPSRTPTPTATGGAALCGGDCDGDGAVAVNELVLGVNIALGNAVVAACARFDADGDGTVAIAELIAAVGNALDGCPRGG